MANQIALALRLMFENPNGEDAQRWYSQGLVFSTTVPDILVQKKGGPCGVLAALEAHVLMNLLFLGATRPEEALAQSIYEILLRAATAASSVKDQPPVSRVLLCSRKSPDVKGPFNPNEEIKVETFAEELAAKRRIEELLKTHWATDAGIMLLILSLILSRGPSKVKNDMDDPEALMTGQFGHCGQEMLNLIITGQASSQVHDGTVELADSGLHLRGVASTPRIGLLTRLEALRYCQVGSYLKNPEFPIWVVGSESHFTVLYSPDKHCDSKSAEQEVFERGKRVFTKKDTQENGFLKIQDVESVMRELGFVPQTEQEMKALQSLISKCEMPGAGGIVLWTTFWPVIGPLMREKKTLAELTEPTWACQVCTLINEDQDAKACMVCMTPRSAESLEARDRAKQLEQARSVQASTKPWTCSTCTLTNDANESACTVCGASKQASNLVQDALMETERGGRKIELVHVDGLEKTIAGKLYPPRKRMIKLTTVDAFLAGPGSSGFGAPFEEVLQTKWPGAIIEYQPGEQAPSIEG